MKLKIILIIFLLFNFAESYAQIVNILDSLKTRMENTSGKEKVEIKIAYGRMMSYNSIEQSYGILREAINESKNNQYIDCLIKAYIGVSYTLLAQAQLDSAYFYLNEAINLSKQYKYNDLTGNAYTTLGFYLFSVDNFRQSYQAFLTSDSILSANPEDEYICHNYVLFSRLLYNLGEYESAISYLQKGLVIAETNGFKNSQVDLLNNLGKNSAKKQNYTEAVRLLNQSIEISVNQNYYTGLSEAYQIYGDYFVDYNQDYANAKYYYDKSFDISTSLGYKSSAATTSTKISHILMLENNFTSALLYAERSLKLREELGNEDLMSSSLVNVGNIYNSLKDFDKASEYIKRGLKIAYRVDILANGYNRLHYARLNLNDYKGALDAYKYYEIFNDSAMKRESFNQVSQIELKYELEKKMHEITNMEYDLQTRKLTYSVILTIGLLVAMIFTTIAYLAKRKLNLRLQRINIDNEKIIEERTVKLKNEIAVREKAEEDLKVALDKEKYLNELKSKFVSIVSHEFRTPLTGIETSVELLKINLEKERQSSKNDKYIKRINNELKRLTALLNDVLSFGTMEKGKIKYTPSETDLLSLIKNLIEYLKRNDDRFIPPDKITTNGLRRNVLCDRHMMETILTNLFINANKYSGDNPVWSIEIKFEENSYDISISDNGIGIPENELPNIFNSFFRGSNTTGIPGTGIGLVTVKQMVDEHNGIISVKNNNSGGVTFKITFPEK